MFAITGANGQLGRRLVRSLAELEPGVPVRALVRSAAAAASLGNLVATHPLLDVRTVDFSNPDSMGPALVGVTRVVHLVGILRETPGNRYADAHEGAVAALIAAASRNGVGQLIALSILGADASDVSDLQSEEALRELANIVGGSVITALGGSDCRFSLGLPQLGRAEAVGEDTACILDAEGARLEVHCHRARAA